MKEELEKLLSEFQESKTFSYDCEVKGDPARLRDDILKLLKDSVGEEIDKKLNSVSETISSISGEVGRIETKLDNLTNEIYS